MRADAARNRRAILDATESLLREVGAANLTMDLVAAAAGVGKGTIFHRFGSRAGLIHALILERVTDLQDEIRSGPAPLGPGAVADERLLAFFDRFVAMVVDGVELIAAYGSVPVEQSGPVHEFWHQHVVALLREVRPDLDDLDTVAWLLIDLCGGHFGMAMIRNGQHDQLAAGIRTVVQSVVAPGAGQVRGIRDGEIAADCGQLAAEG